MTNAAVVEEVPPPFEPTNIIDLVSIDSSKILSVSLYSGRAEVTRLYKFSVKTGQNQVNINGLPTVLERSSIRVEGRGSATIHDVTLSDMPNVPVPSTSDLLDELSNEKELAQRALERTRKRKASLEAYVATLDVQHTDVGTVDKVLDHYDTRGEVLDQKILSIEKKLKDLSLKINDEQTKLSGTPRNAKLGVRAAIGVFAASEGEVAIVLIYAVRSATWKAAYDIRVDMQMKEKPVTLVYKAGIMQDTGESWDDVPLSLETASPTFGEGIPTLIPWTVNVYRPIPVKKSKAFGGVMSRGANLGRLASAASAGADGMVYAQSVRYRRDQDASSDDASSTSGRLEAPWMEHRGLSVSSKGGITATFQVPGSISIPSDGAEHSVTVAQLELSAGMSWVTVPKVETKVHLKAKINNASNYTLLPGVASVYVDGSFISRSDVPLVSPLESFDCPLGLDPSIRITYHPQSKKVTHSGFYSKSSVHAVSQRITVFNTKSTSIENLKVIEQIPVSESSEIVVKLLMPALVIPEVSGSSGERESRAPSAIKVGDGVFAQWEGTDEPGYDVEALGRNGKFNWTCSVPSQGKVNLLVIWEVTAPLRTQIVGL